MAEKSPGQLLLDRLQTPIGEALIVTDTDGRLRALDWADHATDMLRMLDRHYATPLPEAGAAPPRMKRLLDDYFDGDIHCLRDIDWQAAGTPFQCAVWGALVAIQPGTTLSYSALAARLGNPAAVRAVGLANGANPISVVVPCHRVIGANDGLTGYGGGIERKRWLLRHEGAHFQDVSTPRTLTRRAKPLAAPGQGSLFAG